MLSKQSVLIVEDSAPQARLYAQFLNSSDYLVTVVETGAAARQQIQQTPPHLVLLDLNLPDEEGQSILQWIREEKMPTAVVVITGVGSIDIAVNVIKMGADDFIEKPFSAERLRTTVHNLLEKKRLQTLINTYQNSFARDCFEGFIGASLTMQAVYRIIEAVAVSKASVFITGESGTGKEVCARAIHRRGTRANKPFIALNCGAIPRELMESEIFGHTKGAYTGAAGERKGAAALADGGTLFLDEIAEMDVDLQTKLLRFVQTSRFQQVGGSEEKHVDVRFICATNRDPLIAVKEGRLREDLYYRLHVVPIHLPPLYERGADIIKIARQRLLKYATEEDKKFREFSPAVEMIFQQYEWPGNVRQLQNVIRNIVVLYDAEVVEVHHLPAPLNQNSTRVSEADTERNQGEEQGPVLTVPPSFRNGYEVRPLALVEREAIEQAIAFCAGNIPKAAGLLEVSPSTIYRKLQTWNASS